MTKTRQARETRTAYRPVKARPPAKLRARTAQQLAPELPEQGNWTYADWMRLPNDSTRYEVIDGVLNMTPPPAIAHQFTSGNLVELMRAFVRARQLGFVIASPVGVRLPTQPVPLQPDIVYVSAARKSIIGKEYIEGAPDLVVEILSPGNWIYDRKEKYQVYQTAGVPEYWIADYRLKTIKVFALEEDGYALLGKWSIGEVAVSRALDGFQAAVADIFRDI